MWRLHRYYLRELLINASITFLVLFTIVVVSMIARGIQRATGGPLLDAAIITILWALDAFPHLLPISFLLATVLTFTRAAQDREITALRGAGVSPRVPMMAALLVGIALSLIGTAGMHWVLPEIHFRKYRVVAEVIRNVIQNAGLGSGDDRVKLADVTMTFGRLEGRGADAVRTDCWLYLPNERARALGFESPIVHVDRVSIPLTENDARAEDFRALRIVLDNVRDPLTGSTFDQLKPALPVRAISEASRRDERDDDIASSQLLSEVMRGLHEAPSAAVYTLNRRSCFAIMPLLLGPIGFCIALAARDRGRALALVYSLLPLTLFYAGDVFGAKLMRVTDWSVFGWLPAVLLLLLGTPFCWRELRR